MLVFPVKRQELIFKLSTILISALLLYAVGVYDYIIATSSMSARGTNFPPAFAAGADLLTFSYWADMWTNSDLCSNPQILLCSNYPVGKLQFLALFASVILIITGKRVERYVGIFLITTIVAIHCYAFLGTRSILGRAHLVSPPYLVWSAYLFYVLSVVKLVNFAFQKGVKSQMGRYSIWLIAPLTIGLAAYTWGLWTFSLEKNQAKLEQMGPFGLRGIATSIPKKDAIVSRLIEELALHPGNIFNGYAATFWGGEGGFIRRQVSPNSQHNSMKLYVRARDLVDKEFGTKYIYSDLWNYNIPTIEEYGQWVTRSMFMTFKELFANPKDKVDGLGSSLHLYKVDPDILAAFGVKFIISDTPLNHARTKLELVKKGTSKQAVVYLYKIRNNNRGNWSPVKVIQATGFYDTMNKIKKNSTELNQIAVVSETFDSKIEFVPADNVEMRAIKDGYKITGTSAGDSSLLLPIQYSHCWKINYKNSDISQTVNLHRANFVQTLISFHKIIDVEISLDFGLFDHSSCRKMDASDAKEL